MNVDTYTIALIFAVLGFGVFLSFRILNITDLTVEASYGFGAALCGLMCRNHLPYLGLLVAFAGGCLAGAITGLLHTKLKINAILSGILTLTAFYSVNLIVTDSDTVMSFPENTIFPEGDVQKLLVMLGIVLFIGVLLALFFRTKTGLSLRACGDNEEMTKTQCISTDRMKIIGLMLSNGLVALAGALFVQFQGAYFANMERGVMVVGVACIIIGEVVILRKHNTDLILVGIVAGSVLYRLVYSFALELEFIEARDLQLVQSLFLVVILVAGVVTERVKGKKERKKAALQIRREEGVEKDA